MALRECRWCGGPVRVVPLGRDRFAYVHVESREAGRRCRRSRQTFGERLMDRRQLMLPGMEWACE